MSDEEEQIQKVSVPQQIAKRKAKDSVFVDLFRNKSYLLKLYRTLHPEDTAAHLCQQIYRSALHGLLIKSA